MRILSQSELARCTRSELSTLLHRIASELPTLPEGSEALRNAHVNLQNIRKVLAQPRPPGFGPR